MSEDQNQPQKTQFLPVMTASVVLVSIGLIGLIALFVLTVPTLGPRWLLFFLVTLLFSGAALPAVYYLHLRFPSEPPASSKIIVREAILVGIYVDVLLWLQLSKVLNFALAIFIAIGFIAIELILRMRENSRFTSRKTAND